MSETVIRVKQLYKQYRIGIIGTSTLSHDLNRWWAKVRGREDPTLKIGVANQLDTKGGEYVWALKNIDFEVKQGEVLGVIGRNGAGKSTLLKILSRVTGPTKGTVKVKGRIASLLEVGTGFHPELTGKENIFLNGAILGMSKPEINSKFDEIVEFSGVERYIDTPVKRYSSGMYVRLAFAVAAHLDPEILVIDEVLAVGDTEFQKKCLGKMKDIAGEGRTVLFVSHNMESVSTLCNRVLVIDEGEITFNGDVDKGVGSYLRIGSLNKGYADLTLKEVHRSGSGTFGMLTRIESFDAELQMNSVFKIGGKFFVKLEFELYEKVSNLEIGFALLGARGTTYGGFINIWEGFETNYDKGKHRILIDVPYLYLMPGIYFITPWIKKETEPVNDQVTGALEFKVVADNLTGHKTYFERYAQLGVFHRSNWKKL